MSSFIYPNSATRKLFGQAGQALARQNKRFLTIQQRLQQEQREKEISLKKAIDEQLKIDRRKIIKRAIIIASVVILTIIFAVIFL